VTTIAAPPRRARANPRPSARTPTRVPATRAVARPSARPFALGRVGALLAFVTVFALVTAVVFHVVLAQHQMELDRLNVEITKAQRTYEHRRLTASLLASPQHVIQEAERLGLVQPAEPPKVLYVPGAPLPVTDDGSTADTIADWSKTKPSLGPQQP
jgi:hypothetical protein